MNKQVIEIKLHEGICLPQINPNGDWIDLRAAEDIEIKAPILNIHTNQLEFHTGMISLGIALKLPKGYEAIVAPRSSTFKNFGIIVPNSIGIIDNSYNGTNDVWHLPFIGMKKGIILKGDRIAQFRIVPNQFNEDHNNLSFSIVEELSEESRGGFGSTGKQ